MANEKNLSEERALLKDGTNTMEAALPLGTHNLEDNRLQTFTPVNFSSLKPFMRFDSVTSKFTYSGGGMQLDGDLDMDGNSIRNLANNFSEYFVDNTKGNDSATVTGTILDPFATISYALANTSGNVVLHVAPGSYGTALTFDNRYVIICAPGAGYSLVTISATITMGANAGLYMDNVTFSGTLQKGAAEPTEVVFEECYVTSGATISTIPTYSNAFLGTIMEITPSNWYGYYLDGILASPSYLSWVYSNGLKAGGKVETVTDPTAAQDAATKNYVDVTHGGNADVHHAQDHKDTHKSGGGDAFTSSDLLEAVVKRLQESTPTTLTIGVIADGEFMKRSGTNIIGSSPQVSKAGSEASGSFSGVPRKATITFSTAFPDANYSVAIVGDDSRIWTIESKTASGFTINSNSAVALTANVDWTATPHNDP